MVGRKSRERVNAAIKAVMDKLLVDRSAEDSPNRGLRRINEKSIFLQRGFRP